jgi:hypothetical protein
MDVDLRTAGKSGMSTDKPRARACVNCVATYDDSWENGDYQTAIACAHYGLYQVLLMEFREGPDIDWMAEGPSSQAERDAWTCCESDTCKQHPDWWRLCADHLAPEQREEAWVAFGARAARLREMPG